MARRPAGESVSDIIQKARAPAQVAARPARAAAAVAKPARAAPAGKSAREKKLEQDLAEARARLSELESGGAYIDEQAEAAAPPVRTAPRAPREAPREFSREPSRVGAVVKGHDGEVLARRRAKIGDVYYVPPQEIPRGWEYQWNVFTVVGEQKIDMQLEMHANGWRPVPSSRHPGRWTEPAHEGAIVVNGLRLEERPSVLSQEARNEDEARARAQVRDQTEALRLSKKIPEGMAIGQKYRGTGADVRMSIDPALDIPRPQHELDRGE